MARWILRCWKRLRVRELRRSSTVGESLAWEILRNRRCLGLKFRRQHLLRGFILDFYCAELRLAVEIDGPMHLPREQGQWDLYRDRTLASQDITTIRVPDSAITRFRLTSLITEFMKTRTPLRAAERGQG